VIHPLVDDCSPTHLLQLFCKPCFKSSRREYVVLGRRRVGRSFGPACVVVVPMVSITLVVQC
jgi:hypothetical protein